MVIKAWNPSTPGGVDQQLINMLTRNWTCWSTVDQHLPWQVTMLINSWSTWINFKINMLINSWSTLPLKSNIVDQLLINIVTDIQHVDQLLFNNVELKEVVQQLINCWFGHKNQHSHQQLINFSLNNQHIDQLLYNMLCLFSAWKLINSWSTLLIRHPHPRKAKVDQLLINFHLENSTCWSTVDQHVASNSTSWSTVNQLDRTDRPLGHAHAWDEHYLTF